MSGLSNLFRPRNPPRVEVRPVAPGEIAPALSLLLGTADRLADAAHVVDFEHLARHRNIELAGLHVATLDGKLAAAALPVPSPGRTVLLLLSPAGRSTVAAGLLARCAESAVLALPRDERPLVQVLLDPSEQTASAALASAGFSPLATLIYLQRRLKRGGFEPPEPGRLSWVHYSPETHARFARAIMASYEGSLDCPPMRGLRETDDTIAGHRATGDFDPALWFCFTDGDTPDAAELGVLLLSPVSSQPMTELVYLGLSPAARGKGIGEAVMKLALHRAAGLGHELLTLAVDAENTPALKLYYRSGLAEIARRQALFRPPDLTPSPGVAGRGLG